MKERKTVVRSILIPLAAGMLLALCATSATAQDWKGTARVQGQVTDQAGEPIKGATVTLTLDGRGPEPIKTDKRGRWAYLGLTGGNWNVTIEAPGYAISEGVMPVSQAVTNDPLLKSLIPASEAAAAAVADDPAAAAAAEAAEAAAAALSEAGALIDSGDLAGGRAILEETVTTLDPGRQAQVYLAIAQTHLQEDAIDPAIATMQKGLAVDPDHAQTLSLISSILINEGRMEEAQQYMDRMPEGTKVDPNALLNQGITNYNNGDVDTALSQFEAIVADYPEFPDAYYYRGLCHLAKGATEQAKADFTKLLEIAPEHEKAAEAKDFLNYL